MTCQSGYRLLNLYCVYYFFWTRIGKLLFGLIDTCAKQLCCKLMIQLHNFSRLKLYRSCWGIHFLIGNLSYSCGRKKVKIHFHNSSSQQWCVSPPCSLCSPKDVMLRTKIKRQLRIRFLFPGKIAFSVHQAKPLFWGQTSSRQYKSFQFCRYFAN